MPLIRTGTATDVLLATKLAPPAVRAQLIVRSALIERLSAEPVRRLTLLCAPAGWGKTILLTQWVSRTDDRCRRSWLSLDAAENDPVRFWVCVISALRTVSPDVTARAFELVQMGADLRQVVLPTLLNELATIDHEIALVLDDYHLVRNRTVHEQVDFVLERMPNTLHLVIATRADPALPLPRLRARGELLELRAAELRFRPDEAAELYEGVLGLQLTDPQVHLLSRRTEGWAAGLYLAGLSVAGREDAGTFIDTFAGDHRHIVDYLITEVLDTQPAEIRRFLLFTSLLNRLSGALCDALLMTCGSASTLERIERDNLFLVALDSSRRWYRYHHLFADLMRTELHRCHPDLIADLHRRAAMWFVGEGLIDEAIHHLVGAGDVNGAADVIAANWSAVFNQGRLSTVAGWLRTLPAETVTTDPRLGLAQVWIALDSGRLDDAREWIEVVKATRGNDLADVDVMGAQVRVLGAVHCFKSGDIRGALDAARRAIAVDFGDAPLGGAAAYCVYGASMYFSGDTHGAQDAFRQAVGLAEKVGNRLAYSYALGYLAMITAQQGHLAGAEDLIRRATGSRKKLADEEHFTGMTVCLATAMVLDRRGDTPAAADAAHMAVELARRGAGALELTNALAARAEILGGRGKNRADPRRGSVAVNSRNQNGTVTEELTAKEHQTLRLLATRLTRREIAERQYVSLNTVKTHQRALYRKLGVEDRNAAVSRARELDLL